MIGVRPLRIAILSDVNNPHTLRWARVLATRGHELLIFSLVAPSEDYFVGFSNVFVETAGVAERVVTARQGSFGKGQYLRAIPTLRRALRDFRPQVVHAHYVTSYGLLALLSGWRPFAVSVWGMDVFDAPKSALLRQIVRAVLFRADAVLSTSHVMKQQTLRVAQTDISVIPFGVDVARFVPAERRTGRFTIGTVKSLEPKYGIEYLVRAFARLPEYGVALEHKSLLICGAGSLRQYLEELATELGVRESVEFSGRIGYEQVHTYHQRLDIAVFPSVEDSESFGVAVVEAQACGVPAIVSDVGGLPEVVDSGTTGLVVEPRDVDGLARAIARLVLDDEERKRMGIAARARVVDMYSIDECVVSLEVVLTELASRGGKRRSERVSY